LVFLDLWLCLEKSPDTVGHPQSADDSASQMLLLQAQKY
jgi:hypothetical protein